MGSGQLDRLRDARMARITKTPNPKRKTKGGNQSSISSPPYQVLSLPAQMDVIRDDEVVRPIDDLLVRLVRSLRTEGGVSDEALEHDCA